MRYLFLIIIIMTLASCGATSGHLTEGTKKVRVRGMWYSEVSMQWYADDYIQLKRVDTMYRTGDTIHNSAGTRFVILD